MLKAKQRSRWERVEEALDQIAKDQELLSKNQEVLNQQLNDLGRGFNSLVNGFVALLERMGVKPVAKDAPQDDKQEDSPTE